MSSMLELILEERYPKQARLEDGTRIIIRPLISQDETALVDFFKALPEQDILYLRDECRR